MEHFEKTLSSEKIFSGKVINVVRDTVLLENGASSVREVVRHRGAAAIMAVDADGCGYFVKQFRYAVGQALLEVPAGKIDDGEAPLGCAKRELMEECGVTAEKWTELGPFVSSPGFCDEVIWLFLAEKLAAASQNLDDDEFLDVVKIPLNEAQEMVLRGAVPDGKTQALVLKAAEVLAERQG